MRAGLDSHQQRLRLSDLWHFGRRREAFECGREDGMRLGGAAGRMIELGERKGREQLEAARALLLRDGDGGPERLLGRLRASRVALQKDFAAQAMEERELRTLPELMRESQRLVNASQRPFRA